MGSCAKIAQRVVHPAHVPLEREAEPALLDRARHAGPRRRLLGDREAARLFQRDRVVQLAEEVDRLEVLAAAVAVREPLPRLAAVVEVEHRGDGVDAQAVDVELLEPVERVGDQEVPHLVAAVVEDQRAPVGMLAVARILVLVQRACRRSGAARSRPSGSAPGPSRGSRRCRPGAAHRRRTGSRRACRSARSARSSRTPGSPTTRRTGAPSTGSSSTCVKPRRRTCCARRGAISRYVSAAVALLRHARPRAEVHLVDRASARGAPCVAPRRHPLAVAPRVRIEADHARRRSRRPLHRQARTDRS